MNGSDSAQSLLRKKFTAAKSGWFADAADLLSCHVMFFLLTIDTASIVLVVLIFYVQATFEWDPVSSGALSILRRAISTLSVTITSAVIVVAGKRYVLFKLARVRSRRVAVYSYTTIGNLAHYLASHGFELPLSAVRALGLATGLTVNDAWAMVPEVQWMPVEVPFGPFDAPTAPGSLLALASGLLSYAMASVCSGGWSRRADQDHGWHAAGFRGSNGGLLPLPSYIPNSGFSLITPLTGFNVSMGPLSSIPPTAQNLTRVSSSGFGFSTGQLWYEGGDN